MGKRWTLRIVGYLLGNLLTATLAGCSSPSGQKQLQAENQALKARILQLETDIRVLRAPTPEPAPPQPLLIVPGHALGEVTLHQPMPQAFLKAMGPPRRDGNVAPNVWVWPGRSSKGSESYELMIKTATTGRNPDVTAIYISSPDYRTSDGIGVGSSMTAVQQAFPEGQLTEEMSGPCWQTPLISFCTLDGKHVSTLFMGDTES